MGRALSPGGAQGLAELQDKYRGLEVLAFPCNQFGAQEPGDNKQIKAFAAAKGFKGPLFAKVDVNGAGGAFSAVRSACFYPSLDRLFDHFCRLLDRLSDQFAKHWVRCLDALSTCSLGALKLSASRARRELPAH